MKENNKRKELDEKQIRKRKIIKFSIIILICLVLIALSAVCVFVVNDRNFERRYDFSNIEVKSRKIDSEKDFIKAIEHSSSSKSKAYYHLSSDISLSVEELGKCGEIDFYGELDGFGHTVKIVESVLNSQLQKPIFTSIKKDAVVRRLNIVVGGGKGKVSVGSDVNSKIAVLAESNYGTIDTCAIVINNFYIGLKCKTGAVLVNKNYNNISNVALTVKKVSYSSELLKWQCTFGGLVSVNYGRVSKIFVDVVVDVENKAGDNSKIFPLLKTKNEQVINDGQIQNSVKVGYVFGAYSEKSKIDADTIYIFKNILDNTSYDKHELIDGWIIKESNYGDIGGLVDTAVWKIYSDRLPDVRVSGGNN